MTDQEIYNIAEWLAYNQEVVFKSIGSLKDENDILDQVIYEVSKGFPQYNLTDIECAFDDERLQLVFEFYYLKGGEGYVH